MHNISRATGLAIVRRLAALQGYTVPPGTEQEAADFAERARLALCLDNSAMTAAMIFAQPCIANWHPQWKFAYTVGLALGTKLTTEGFYLGDIIERLTNEFPIDILMEGERHILQAFEWGRMNERCRTFRNALVHVALENPEAADAPKPPTVVPEDAAAGLHVIVVDDDEVTCELHVALVRRFVPNARVAALTTEAAAVTYWQRCCDDADHVQLILLDLDLEDVVRKEAADAQQRPLLQQVLAAQNGFNVAAALSSWHTPDFLPPKDFRFKPLVALVTAHALDVSTSMDMGPDGSVEACDMVLPKPLDARSMRVLIECCGV